MSKEILSFSEAEIKAIAKFLYCFDAECAESEDEWIVTLWKWGGDFIQCQGTDIPSALASAMHSAGCHITTDCNLPTYKPATDPATIEQGLIERQIAADNTDHFGGLPLFPTLYDYPTPITEERIEQAVERITDVADRQFMAGKSTQKQYDCWTQALNRWADSYYAKL